MIRSWIMAILLVSTLCGVSEARGRNRGVRYQTPVYRTQSPVVSTASSTQVVSQNLGNGSQQPIQQVSYSNSNTSSAGYGNSMQAWAEEEARMMASRGTCGHIRPAPPGYFVGVGCGMTCMGRGTLVAEAHFNGKSVRVWRQ